MSVYIDIVITPGDGLIETLSERAGIEFVSLNHRFFNDEHNILLVAFEDEDKPCGILYAYCLERMETTRPMMMIYAIEVFKAYRKQGIGTKLMDKLQEIAEDMDCSKIFLITNDDNEAAKALYEKAGYERPSFDDILYAKKLDK